MRFFRRRAEGGELEDWQPRLWAVLISLVVIALYLIAFIVENSAHVTIHFVLFKAHLSLIWLIILLLVIGFVGGVLASQLYRRRRRLGSTGQHEG